MSGYSSVQAHRSMAFDTTRNNAYLKAIKQIINSNSIVMDLGAGIGIHGFAAAKAGAKKVYLVEPEPIICIAKQIAEANKLANIETRQTRIEQLTLPEKVDIIISVFTGNFLLTEDLLPSLFMARDKFLAPGGTLIPDRAQMIVVPVSAPDYYHKHIDKWSENQESETTPEAEEINLSLVRRYAANSIYYDSHELLDTVFLAAPGKLLDLDLMTANEATCHSKIEVSIEQDSICHGWLGWFNIRLGDDWLSTSPEAETTHWRQAFLPLDPPLELHVGDQVTFELQRPENGEWTWTMEVGKHKQRHSTFFSEPITPSILNKKSDKYAPTLDSQGKITQQLLSSIDGKTTVENLAKQLLRDWPDNFTDKKEALRFIKNIIEKQD